MLKKYRFLKYALAILAFDLLTRNGFEFGGGMLVMIGAILTVLYFEHEKSHSNE